MLTYDINRKGFDKISRRTPIRARNQYALSIQIPRLWVTYDNKSMRCRYTHHPLWSEELWMSAQTDLILCLFNLSFHLCGMVLDLTINCYSFLKWSSIVMRSMRIIVHTAVLCSCFFCFKSLFSLRKANLCSTERKLPLSSVCKLCCMIGTTDLVCCLCVCERVCVCVCVLLCLLFCTLFVCWWYAILSKQGMCCVWEFHTCELSHSVLTEIGFSIECSVLIDIVYKFKNSITNQYHRISFYVHCV